LADRKKDVCFHITPVYYGDRGVATRGNPFTSKDYYYECYVSEEKNKSTHRQANNIEELCKGCKKYLYVKPLTKEEIREKYYDGKDREVMVVTTTGFYFKKI
jgi:hypothetical protein